MPVERLKEALEPRGAISVALLDYPELDIKGLKDLGDRGASLGDVVLVLIGRAGDKVPFLARCSDAAVAAGVRAGDLAGRLSAHLGGGGGGKPSLAQGQGLRADGVAAALDDARALLADQLPG